MDESLVCKRLQAYALNTWEDVNLPYEISDDIINTCIEFFRTGSRLIYPAKSYFVAIVYAQCMVEYFGQNFFDVLSDRDLLPDDKYFKPYPDDKLTYDAILNHIDITNVLTNPSCASTIDYFKREFMLCN